MGLQAQHSACGRSARVARDTDVLAMLERRLILKILELVTCSKEQYFAFYEGIDERRMLPSNDSCDRNVVDTNVHYGHVATDVPRPSEQRASLPSLKL